ncbi:MAG: oligosaccharide flippase family protein [Candidatus Shapirobacteria bacterium]
MSQTTYEEVKNKSIRSVIMLSARNLLIQSVSIIGFFGLSLLLGPSEIGIFALVAEVVSILGYFSDIGLAPALIQQKNPPTLNQLRSVFSVQQLLVLLSALIFLVFYPQISAERNFGFQENLIVYSLIFAYISASLKTIPSILLERKLEFGRLSQVDILENVVFYLSALFFASQGFGLVSYAYATFIRSLLGVIYLYVLSPWSIGLAFDFKSVKNLLSYGLPFQINSFIALAKDRLSNVFVAGILGSHNFGLISWAQKGPRIPLSFMDSIIRVSFPAYSRLQSDPKRLSTALGRNLFFIALVIFPAMSLLSLIVSPVVDLIPKYHKWDAALLPFYYFCFYYAIAAITTPLTNAYNAVGEVKTTFRFMLMWTVLTWLLLPSLSLSFGLFGAIAAYTLIGLSSLVVWYFAGRRFNLNIPSLVRLPALYSLISLIMALLISRLFSQPLLVLISRLSVFSLSYLIFSYKFFLVDLKWIFSNVKTSLKS